ncbi:phage tail protein [Pasteurellaceae bacterium LFhippo2]|nr:phage tail protein [Pasteurellaceae bacterium LFhippo2]
MNTANHLLPSGSSSLEKRAAECLRIATQNDIPIPHLINPHKCPTALLPYLAWAFSVDRWEEYWPESVKRQAIIQSYQIHKKKGTVSAVRRIVESLGYDFEIREWFVGKKTKEPGTFRLFVELKNQGVNSSLYEELIRLVEDAKPVSRHMTELAIVVTAKGKLNISTVTHSGEIISIFPKQPTKTTTVQRLLKIATASHSGDIITIY